MKKVCEISLHAIGFLPTLSPPTRTHIMNTAVNNAIEFYASSLGVTKQEAINLYKESESTRECIALLVLAQADSVKLKAMVSLLS